MRAAAFVLLLLLAVPGRPDASDQLRERKMKLVKKLLKKKVPEGQVRLVETKDKHQGKFKTALIPH
jgi:hypothetical protein